MLTRDMLIQNISNGLYVVLIKHISIFLENQALELNEIFTVLVPVRRPYAAQQKEQSIQHY
ncbi:MAG: hypothetical protein WAM73_18115 [Desulfobacterales bacterium]